MLSSREKQHLVLERFVKRRERSSDQLPGTSKAIQLHLPATFLISSQLVLPLASFFQSFRVAPFPVSTSHSKRIPSRPPPKHTASRLRPLISLSPYAGTSCGFTFAYEGERRPHFPDCFAQFPQYIVMLSTEQVYALLQRFHKYRPLASF